MPTITAFVDAFRAAGLTDNAALKRGLADGTFNASEGGSSVGMPPVNEPVFDEDGNVVGRRVAGGVAVQPVLSLAAEVRLLDREGNQRFNAEHRKGA